ncbi:MAG: hypothetical protein FWE91_09120 [Defluviitaleaceae bacterium]|nr:hypothetical protein [Defluviitaleaceae bacterium]MCL2835787.1 hypothetical protein [Defluviitaleaceae bacterium]
MPNTNEHYGMYEAIVDATNSEVILFFIIVAIVMAVVVAPLYIAVLKDRRETRKHESERDANMQATENDSRQQLMGVIEKNSEAITRLSVTLDKNSEKQVEALKRVHERLDSKDTVMRAQHSDIVRINTNIENMMQNLLEMASKINKIFVLTSGGNLSE